MVSQLSAQDNEERLQHKPFLEDSERETLPKDRRAGRNLLRYSLGILAVLVSLIIFIIYSSHLFPRTELHCGNTTEEARSLGCEFDLLSYSWTPKQCFDRETALEFKEWLLSPDRFPRSWPFFEDRNNSQWVPDEAALSERVHILSYAPNEEHFGHCVFMMRRLHRINSGGAGRANSRIKRYKHTEHCTNTILDAAFSQLDLRGPAHFGVTFETC